MAEAEQRKRTAAMVLEDKRSSFEKDLFGVGMVSSVKCQRCARPADPEAELQTTLALDFPPEAHDAAFASLPASATNARVSADVETPLEFIVEHAQVRYRLAAVVCHAGDSANSGHYKIVVSVFGADAVGARAVGLTRRRPCCRRPDAPRTS